MQTTEKKPSSEPRSLSRVFKIFEALADDPNGLTLSGLATSLAAPKSSLLLLLRPLVLHGYLSHENDRYTLGSEIFRFSAKVLSARSFTRIVRPFLEDLARESTESVYLAVLNRDAGTVTYVEGIESKNLIRYVAPIGTTRPLYVSAAGQALLAFQDEDWQEQYIRKTKLISPADKHIISKKDLRADLSKIYKERVAISISGAVLGAGGIAAPIVIGDAPVTTAFLISAPSDRLQHGIPGFKRMLLKTAEKAAVSLSAVGNIIT